MKLSMASGGLYVKAVLALLVVPVSLSFVACCMLKMWTMTTYTSGNDKVLAKHEIENSTSGKQLKLRAACVSWYRNEGLPSATVT